MSPEYREKQNSKRQGRGRLLRLIASAAVLLVCVCIFTVPSYAWTEIPEELLSQLSPEQQALIAALPEADRPLAYCYFTDTDALTFFKQYSGYADLIARQGLTSSYSVGKYLTGNDHSDFSTPSGQAEKQFLMELYFGLSGSFGSYRDLSQPATSVWYFEKLQNMTLAKLQEMRTSLDTGRIFNEEELPMWKSILDAWIVYRSGSPESQATGAGRDLYNLYISSPYPALDNGLQQLMNEMPAVYKLLTYASLSGTDGLGWLREESEVSFDLIEKYWSMDRSDLDTAYSDLARAGNADSTEGLFILQLYALKAGCYPMYNAGTWGIDYSDTIWMQNFPRSGEKISESYENVRSYMERNSSSLRWKDGCDMELACKAWMNYFSSLAPKAISEAEDARLEREETAARLAGLDWTSAQERSDSYRQQNGKYSTPAVNRVPDDQSLDDAQVALLRSAPARYIPHIYHFFRPDLSAAEVMTLCVTGEYTSAAVELLALDSSALESEYVRLANKASVSDLDTAEAARLELAAQILLCRVQDDGRDSFGSLELDYDKKTGRWNVAYYTVSYELYSSSGNSISNILEGAKNMDQSILFASQRVQLFTAISEYKTSMKVDPFAAAFRDKKWGGLTLTDEILDAAKRIRDVSVSDMKVYATAIAIGLIDPDSSLVYAEMPEQLWARREKGEYGGAAQSTLNTLISFYGAPDYRDSSRPGYYTMSDSGLKAIIELVRDYPDDARAEAQRILWHRNAEFYSEGGNYHSKLARMSADELTSYRTQMEAEYFASTDAARTAELQQWIEQINAWLAWRNAVQPQSSYSGGTSQSGADPSSINYNSEYSSEGLARPYILEVSTGEVSGDNIEFFRIIYETAGGDSRTQYIFPSEDSLKTGYLSAQAAGAPTRVLEWVSTNAGYTAAGPDSAKALQSYHTDQFLFNADEDMSRVTEIQAFMRSDTFAGGKNEWTCTGLRLYKVEKLQGLARYGYYSSDYYIDFSGPLLAELEFGSEDLKNISWRGNDTLFRFGGTSGETGYALSASSGSKRIQSSSPNVIFRVDFADQYMAGLECLATGTGSSQDRALSRPGNLCEALSLIVRYRDVYGSMRVTTLPMVISAASWSAIDGNINSIIDYAGLAQQGGTIGFEGVLPDLEEVLYVTPVLGGTAAASAADLALSSMSNAADRDRRIAASDSESASILCIAVYDAARGRLSAEYQGSFLHFEYPSLPDRYYSAADITGIRLDAGGATSTLEMRSYSQGSDLLPRDRSERYMVTLVTDDAEMAGTRSDIMLRLNYTDLDGSEKQTPEYSIRSYAGDFYGYWPATADDFGYLYGVSSISENGSATGRSISVIIPIQDVKRFTSATIRLESPDGSEIDEWQMKDLVISTVKSVGSRSIKWQNVRVPGGSGYSSAESDRVITRSVDSTVIFDLALGGAVDPQSPVKPSTPVFDPLLIQDGTPNQVDVDTGLIEEREDVDWRDLRYNMTYADAMQDLGFLKTRGVYSVQVKVASNVNNISGNDDCGSKNQFYFQLLFSQGDKSAVVLANQQLQSDGFQAGSTETFTITTSQDYGDLSGIRIIAEDLASDSDKYDKLNIESITVIRQDSGQISPLWRFNEVGWIGIDYRDEGQETSLGGVNSRTMEEISHVYNVSESSYAVNVQFAISTSQYKDKNGDPCDQFTGSLGAEITYRDTNGMIQRVNVEDVVLLMYQYNNRSPQYTAAQSNGQYVNGQAVSDPDYMFRANHTDRFIVPLDGLEQLLNIKLFPRSSVNTVWNITDVTASLVRGTGRRILNVAGEYTMKYAEGKELQLIARSNSTGSPKYSKQLYITNEAGGSGSSITVNFTSERVQTDTGIFDTQTLVSEVPSGGTDSFNIVFYPKLSGSVDSVYDYDLSVNIRYTTASDTIVQNGAKMNKTIVDGVPVFYIEGLSASGMVQLNSINVKSSSSGSAGITGGFAQHVRSGYVIESFDLGAAANLEYATSVPFSQADVERQTVSFQLGSDTPRMQLSSGVNDVAVSIHYITEGPIKREYQSKRYFLASEGISSIAPGQLITLTMTEGHVGRITGVTLIPTGQTSLELAGGYAVDKLTRSNGTVETRGRYSFGAADGVRTGVIRKNTVTDSDGSEGSIVPITLTFSTGGSGIDVPVTIAVDYYDSKSEQKILVIDDIRPYLTEGAQTFASGGTATAVILAEDVKDVRWIELTVDRTSGSSIALWDLRSVSCTLGESGASKTRSLSDSIPEGETRRISFANIYVSGEVVSPIPRDGSSTSQTRTQVSGGKAGVLVASGQGVRVTVDVSGSYEGFDAQIFSLDPQIGVTGQVSMESNHGYSKSYLDSLAEEAGSVLSGSQSTSAEKSAANDLLGIIDQLRNASGSFSRSASGITFMAPRNYGTGSLYYRIEVSSTETGEPAFTVDVTVRSEERLLESALQTMRDAVIYADTYVRVPAEDTQSSGESSAAEPGSGSGESSAAESGSGSGES